jgi:hypothetical protein
MGSGRMEADDDDDASRDEDGEDDPQNSGRMNGTKVGTRIIWAVGGDITMWKGQWRRGVGS